MKDHDPNIISVPFVFVPDGTTPTPEMQRKIDSFRNCITVRGVWEYPADDDCPPPPDPARAATAKAAEAEALQASFEAAQAAEARAQKYVSEVTGDGFGKAIHAAVISSTEPPLYVPPAEYLRVINESLPRFEPVEWGETDHPSALTASDIGQPAAQPVSRPAIFAQAEGVPPPVNPPQPAQPAAPATPPPTSGLPNMPPAAPAHPEHAPAVPPNPQPTPRAYQVGEEVIIRHDDGTEEVRSGGSVAWRRNNPGNITDLAPAYGAIGNGPPLHHFAIFADEATGLNAIVAKFRGPHYGPIWQ